MASLTPQKIVLSNINGGQQFANGDVVTPEAINSPIQASAYAQALATNQPDVSEAGKVGTPSVSIITASDGTPRLKFSNLKGATGASGGSSGGSVSATIKPLYTHNMQGSGSTLYPFEVKINKLNENGAVIALTAGTSGCYIYAPTALITYGEYYPAEQSDLDGDIDLEGYNVVLSVSSRDEDVFTLASVSSINVSGGIKGIMISLGNNSTDTRGYKNVVFDITINDKDKSIYINISDYKSTYIVD